MVACGLGDIHGYGERYAGGLAGADGEHGVGIRALGNRAGGGDAHSRHRRQVVVHHPHGGDVHGAEPVGGGGAGGGVRAEHGDGDFAVRLILRIRHDGHLIGDDGYTGGDGQFLPVAVRRIDEVGGLADDQGHGQGGDRLRGDGDFKLGVGMGVFRVGGHPRRDVDRRHIVILHHDGGG